MNKQTKKTIATVLLVVLVAVGAGEFTGGVQLFNGKPPRPGFEAP